MTKTVTTILVLLLCPLVASAQDGAMFHIIPQVADGRFADGTDYHTDFLVTNVIAGPTTCTLNLYGVPTSRLQMPGATTFSLPNQGSAGRLSTNNSETDPIVSGYATLSCDALVTAQAVYVSSGPGETGALSLATVFSSPSASVAQIPLFLFENFQRLGLAIANDSDTDAQYDIEVLDFFETVVATTTANVSARSNSAQFVSDMVMIPFDGGEFFGQVRISSTVPGTPFSAIGLHYIFLPQILFTTFPATRLAP